MKNKILAFLVLSSLFFNIAHASIIAIEDDCQHESVEEYVLEYSQSTDCGDLCDTHHLFHFLAILDEPIMTLNPLHAEDTLLYTPSYYSDGFHKTTIKPPIA